jgi:hypothetical protein
MQSNHMNAAAIRTAARYFGAWGAIVCLVVFLSFLFTVLGTITCAVLAGMMLGALKGAKWFSASVSFVFPGVVFGLVRLAKVELTPEHVLLLGGLCFGVFWVTYLVSAYVWFCEQSERDSSKPPAPAMQSQPLGPGEPVAAPGYEPAAEPLGATVPTRESWLEQLQGNWVCEAAGASEPRHKKFIQIKEAQLELKTIDARGQMTLLTTGEVTLQCLTPCKKLEAPKAQ